MPSLLDGLRGQVQVRILGWWFLPALPLRLGICCGIWRLPKAEVLCWCVEKALLDTNKGALGDDVDAVDNLVEERLQNSRSVPTDATMRDWVRLMIDLRPEGTQNAPSAAQCLCWRPSCWMVTHVKGRRERAGTSVLGDASTALWAY